MKRFIKLTTMVSLLLLSLVLLASDSMGMSALSDTETRLMYNGDLVISGKIDIYDEGDLVDNISSNDLDLDVEFYEISDTEGIEDNLIFSMDRYPFSLKGDYLEVVLNSQDVNIKGRERTDFKIVLKMRFDNGDFSDNFEDTIYYTFIPEK